MQMKHTVIKGRATCSLDKAMSEESLGNSLSGLVRQRMGSSKQRNSYELRIRAINKRDKFLRKTVSSTDLLVLPLILVKSSWITDRVVTISTASSDPFFCVPPGKKSWKGKRRWFPFLVPCVCCLTVAHKRESK